MKALTRQVFTLQAYQSYPVNCAGSLIVIAQASGDFILSIDGGEENDVAEGYIFNNAPDSFRMLLARNPGATAVNVVLYIGAANISFFPHSLMAQVVDAQTYTKGTALGGGNAMPSIAGGVLLEFPGTDNGNQRKQIVFYNGDAAAVLYILDAKNNGKLLVPLNAGEKLTFESSGYFALFNFNGAAVNYSVGETFYAP